MRSGFRSLALALTVAVGALSPAIAAAPGRQTPPDNTKVNRHDAPTAQQQSNKRTDLETSRQIRRSIVSDKALSTYAHNVKVITKNGRVTLTGPVRSEEEKASVEAKAAEVAGAANVTDRMAVATRAAR